MAILPFGLHIDEIGELVAPDIAAGCGEHQVGGGPAGLVGRQGHDGRNRLALLQGQQIDQALAAGLRRAQGQLIDLDLVDHAAGREEQQRAVGSATNSWWTKSSSRVAMPARPLPPRR